MSLKQTGVELIAKGEAQFNAALKNADKNVQQFGQGAQKAAQQVNAAGGGMNQAASQVQKFSAAARGGFMAAAQSATLLGENIASVAGPLNSAVSGVTQLASAGLMLGPVGLVIGGISLALGAVIAKLQEQQRAAEEAAAAMVKGYTDARAALQKMMEPDPLEVIARSTGIAAAELHKYAQTSTSAAAQLNQLVTVQETMVRIEQKLADARARSAEAARNLALAQERLATGGIVDEGAVFEYSNALASAKADIGYYSHALLVAKAANDELTGAINANVGALIQQRSLAASAFPMAKLWTADFNVGAQTAQWWANRVTDAQERVNNAMGQFSDPLEQWTYDQIKAYQDGQAAAQEWARKTTEAYNKVKSAVESAISPTKVTDEDMEAAKKGTYKTKWDETRRRLEAVAAGTPASAYGPEFEKQVELLKQLGYNAETAAAAFEDMTLFANPENIDKFVDLNAIYADVNRQLEGMAGKANLVNRVMDDVWAHLSPAAKSALATQGIETAADAVKELVNPAGAAEDKVKGLNTEIGKIPLAKTTTFNVEKAPTFDPNLAKVLDDLSLIEKEADIVVTLYYESKPKPPNGGTPPPPDSNVPPAGGGPGGYQHGGYGVFDQTRSVLVHRGEGFWFSGVNWNVPFPQSFERRIHHPPPVYQSYGGDVNAPINIEINANLHGGSRADVDYLADRVAGRLRDQLLSYRRARA